MADLEYPKIRRSLPKYLTMEQSAALLQSVSGQNQVRDYAILMLFLNCGIRRSELVGLNRTDVYEDRIRVVGKGNKERFVYFGTPCRKALDDYLEERNQKVLTDDRGAVRLPGREPYQRFGGPSIGEKGPAAGGLGCNGVVRP